MSSDAGEWLCAAGQAASLGEWTAPGSSVHWQHTAGSPPPSGAAGAVRYQQRKALPRHGRGRRVIAGGRDGRFCAAAAPTWWGLQQVCGWVRV